MIVFPNVSTASIGRPFAKENTSRAKSQPCESPGKKDRAVSHILRKGTVDMSMIILDFILVLHSIVPVLIAHSVEGGTGCHAACRTFGDCELFGPLPTTCFRDTHLGGAWDQ